MSSYYERKILSVLKKHRDGLTTVNIAKEADISKTTALKYLASLRAEGKIDFIEVGPAKLWRIKEAEKPKKRRRAPASKLEKLNALLEDFKEITGVDGLAVLDSDGFTISADLPPDIDPKKLGGLMALLIRAGMRSVDAANLKSLEGIIVEGGGGRIVAHSKGKVMVIAFSKPDKPLGTIRVEIEEFADKINEILK
ncbi:hypothetical protein DRO55_05460 [Candidatus Bathyarchaeota archaeon]|nr:MAG: hypothetical protein DRO55_05460 [Candidatus Bathyarchaeota archaeon]